MFLNKIDAELYKNIVNYNVLGTWDSKMAFRRGLQIEVRKAQS